MIERIKISYEDLNDPKIDEVIDRQVEETALRRGAGAVSQEKQKVSLIHKSWFYLMIAGGVGAIIAWMVVEPYFDDTVIETDNAQAIGQTLLMFMSVGGLIGLMIGCTEGILARNFSRAAKGGAIGFGIGFGGGLVSTFGAGLIFGITAIIGVLIVGERAVSDPANHILTVLIIAMIARSLGWAVAGMTVGLGPGIALKAKKMTYNGFLGGMIGGIIGGLLFDPISYVVSGGTLEAGEASRAVGFTVIGLSAGLMIGLVEMLTKDAWLLMTAGPLKGKQFIVYKNPTMIGSSPKCEIYLFKDSAIEPFHASIHIMRDGYEIEDLNSASGTFINGRQVKRQRLISGDTIQIGETKFIYTEKEKKPDK